MLAEGAPSAPGIYLFLAPDGELLYVGKAANLRARLRQHVAARPGADQRRLAALYRLTAEVRWQLLPDAAASAAREADVIVALRPRFNASHIHDGRWNFVVVGLETGGDRLRFALSPTWDGRTGRAYGCFPHLGPGVTSPPAIACRDGYPALLRLLWASANPEAITFPGRLTGSAPEEVDIRVLDSHRQTLHAFLAGTSDRLLTALSNAVDQGNAVLRPGLSRDLVDARAFFAAGPQALRRLRVRHGVRSGPMPRRRIEDLVAADLQAAIGPFRRPNPLPAADADAERFLGRRAQRWRAG
jgi:hypothetical protein